MEIDQELKQLNLKITKIKLIGSIGPILLGLALYNIFPKFDKFIENDLINYSMLVAGILAILVELYFLLPLFKQKTALNKLR